MWEPCPKEPWPPTKTKVAGGAEDGAVAVGAGAAIGAGATAETVGIVVAPPQTRTKSARKCANRKTSPVPPVARLPRVAEGIAQAGEIEHHAADRAAKAHSVAVVAAVDLPVRWVDREEKVLSAAGVAVAALLVRWVALVPAQVVKAPSAAAAAGAHAVTGEDPAARPQVRLARQMVANNTDDQFNQTEGARFMANRAPSV